MIPDLPMALGFSLSAQPTLPQNCKVGDLLSLARCHARNKDFTVTQAAVTLSLLRNGALLQNYPVSGHLPHLLSAASLRFLALLGKSWGCPCIKTICVIGTDPPGTLVPQSCSKYGGKAQGQVLQGAQRDQGWKWKEWFFFISQDATIPKDSYWHRAA